MTVMDVLNRCYLPGRCVSPHPRGIVSSLRGYPVVRTNAWNRRLTSPARRCIARLRSRGEWYELVAPDEHHVMCFPEQPFPWTNITIPDVNEYWYVRFPGPRSTRRGNGTDSVPRCSTGDPLELWWGWWWPGTGPFSSCGQLPCYVPLCEGMAEPAGACGTCCDMKGEVNAMDVL